MFGRGRAYANAGTATANTLTAMDAPTTTFGPWDRRVATIVDLPVALETGKLKLFRVALPTNTPISQVTFKSGTTGATSPTNQWAGLFTAAGVLLAVSADALTGAWTGNTDKTFTWTTVNTSTAGTHYIGLMVKATVAVPSLVGVLDVLSSVGGESPLLSMTCDTGLSTPPTIPFTAGAGTVALSKAYFKVA